MQQVEVEVRSGMPRNKQTKPADLSDAGVLERAKSLASDWKWAVSLQVDRIATPREEDQKFNPVEADPHFLVIALGRLRHAAATVEHVPKCWDAVKRAIASFDSAVPWRKRLRDVFEHIEDYAVDSDDRRTETSRHELQVWLARKSYVNWLGYDVDWRKAYDAAMDLYVSVNSAYDSFAMSVRREQEST